MKSIMRTKYLVLAALALAIVGCDKDYLETAPTNNQITTEQFSEAAPNDPELANAGLTGLYLTMVRTQTGGTTGHDDFGHRGYDIFADMLSGDVALSVSTYGWYRSSITEFQGTQDFTFTDNYQVWRYYYRIVYYSNLIIESFGGNDAQPETDLERYSLGQAHAMRAHGYFYLTQYMINDVEAAWTQPTLPLYTTPATQGLPKSTTEEVYALMEADLTKAIGYLDGFQRSQPYQVNQPVAQTMLAYVLASRRDRWGEVAQLTQNALNGTTAQLMNNSDTPNGILGGFNNVSSQGWMWGIDINDNIGLGLVSWWGQMDAFSYSYAAVGDNKVMDVDLYESMPADDVRRNQFFNNPSSSRHLQPLFKFYDSDRVIFGTSQIVKADYHYLRYADVLLLNAEALAKSGQEGAARTKLLQLVSARVGDPSFVNGLSGQALIDEIYKQTRLELWGEGKSYLALKRNKETVVRGANHLSFVGEPIPYNDERLTFEIPLQEIQDNNNISDQN